MMLKKINQKDHVINLYSPAPVFWPIWISLDHVVLHKHQLGQDYLCCQRYTGKVYQYTVNQVGLTLTITAKRSNAPYTTVLEDSGFASPHISGDDVCLVAYLASQTLIVMEGIYPKLFSVYTKSVNISSYQDDVCLPSSAPHSKQSDSINCEISGDPISPFYNACQFAESSSNHHIKRKLNGTGGHL